MRRTSAATLLAVAVVAWTMTTAGVSGQTTTIAPSPGATVSPADRDCWICGKTDGMANLLGDRNAVVAYVDPENILRKYPCSLLAELANNRTFVPLTYCSRLIEQAIVPCRCTTPFGDVVTLTPSLSPALAGSGGGGGFGSRSPSPFNRTRSPAAGAALPTKAPSPGATVSPVVDRDCWICGKTDGVENVMGDGNAVVDYVDHEGIFRKFPCNELARLASDTIAVPLSYCDSLIRQAIVPCRCATPNGDLLPDPMTPSLSPAQSAGGGVGTFSPLPFNRTRSPASAASAPPTNSPTPAFPTTLLPSRRPTLQPTQSPTTAPTQQPSDMPSFHPSVQPSDRPSESPTSTQPTMDPTSNKEEDESASGSGGASSSTSGAGEARYECGRPAFGAVISLALFLQVLMMV